MKLPKQAWNMVEIYGFTVGLAAIAQMVWFFIELAFLGVEHVAAFEPNPTIRVTEALLAVSGFVALLTTTCRVLGRRPQVVVKHQLTPQQRLDLLGRL